VKQNDESSDYGLWIGSSPNHLIDNIFFHLLNQFRALIIKRFIYTYRNKSLALSQLIFPIFLLIVNLVFMKYGPLRYGDSPELSIDFSMYSNNYAPYYTNTSDNNSQNELTTVHSLAKYYEYSLKEHSNVKIFNLKDTNEIKFCSGVARKSIEKYLSCLGVSSHRLSTLEHFVAVDFSYTRFIKRRERSRPSLRILGHFNNQVFSYFYNIYFFLCNSFLIQINE